MSGKKVLFIDRDGTLIKEPPVDYQVDSLEKLEFLPGAIGAMSLIAKLDYYLAMVSNQDGLGTDSFPEDTFHPAQNKMLSTLEGEGVSFDAIHIDPSFEHENSNNRKPRTGMLTAYFSDEFDLENSFVIGDRTTDVELAKNMGCKAIFIRPEQEGRAMLEQKNLSEYVELITDSWEDLYHFLRAKRRRTTIERKTKETDIKVMVDLDKSQNPQISTGIGFFDHMLEQIAYHASISVTLECKGDLHVDTHHTIEDCAIALGEAFHKALADKVGINRYGFALPMDECSAQVLIDFGGRIDFIWDVEFTTEYIGEMPTEMFKHFFKSFASAAICNLHISASGENNHHKIEGIFKAFARAIKSAIKREPFNYELPSSKGVL